MSSLLTTIREFLGPPDPRSEREIEDDIDAEFAFHIEQIEAELIEQGVPPEHAADLARARFGNQHKLKQRCKRIALEERTMLQKINTVLMIIVMLAVIGVSIQMYVTQRHNTLVLQDITTQIAKMRIDAQLEGKDTALSVDEAEPRVLVEGDVEQPGWYSFKPGETLMRDLLAEIGTPPERYVRYDRGGSGMGRPVRAESLYEGALGRRLITPNDRIYVFAHDSSQGQTPRQPQAEDVLQSGSWREVNEDGELIDGGITLDLLASNDIHNPRDATFGTLSIPGDDREIRISFPSTRTRATTPTQLIISIGDDPQQRMTGRWMLEGTDLILNLARGFEHLVEPIRLRRISDD